MPLLVVTDEVVAMLHPQSPLLLRQQVLQQRKRTPLPPSEGVPTPIPLLQPLLRQDPGRRPLWTPLHDWMMLD